MRPGTAERTDAMLNIWTDWPAMADLVKSEKIVLNDVSTTGIKMRPAYSDEMYREEFKQKREKDQEIAQLKVQAEKLFEAHNFKEAQVAFTKLAEELPDDWVINLKCSCCYTFSPQESDVELGEKYIRKVIQLCPVLPGGYTILGQNLCRRGKYSEAVEAIEQMVSCPKQEEETPDNIMDGVKVARDSLIKLNRIHEFAGILNRAKAKYPLLSSRLDEAAAGIEAEQLWEQGRKFISEPKKDFVQGQALFTRLAQLRPDDYWATLLAGGCFTWGGKPAEGETYIRKAMQLDPNIPNGYALLAQNQFFQGKIEGVVSSVNEMMKKTFTTIPENQDHNEKIIEALNYLSNVTGRDARFQNCLGIAKSKYPSLIQKLNTI